MRAVVLANNRIIAYLNENFINTWVSNVELERTPNKQTLMALRRQQGFKPFDKKHPLAQAIAKGWKKHSPSDSLVISPKLALMGRQPVNELLWESDKAQHYLTFLKESLAGKLHGLSEDTPNPQSTVDTNLEPSTNGSTAEKLHGLSGNAPTPQSTNWDTLLESGAVGMEGLNVVLTDENSEQEVLSVFRTPETDAHDYTVIKIDVTAFEDGGTLIIDVWVGDAEVPGSFDLFADNTTKLVPDDALASARDIPMDQREVIKYAFNRGKVFKLGTIGSSSGKGKINGFLAKISVEPASEKNDEN